ncbi:FtsB family cell division protein [Prevotella sp. OH937_COT-195]|uniref:FtsB family cell division protein n=1 Tax=Prevotella sp. OH937_COT-195 TaxID=2491051 RepID=UPI000F6478A6|nr:septum formation initiator family protein [Prevotella sp. OH937_COT-195]RRD02710.1 septum formation initiator family protein [Prevotella sp. OH937_COT-195]
MNNRLNSVVAFFGHNKYWIVIVVGILVVGILDENSFLKRIRLESKINDLKEQVDEYNGQYEKNMNQLRELETNPKAIEKIARERYFMKADDEDIFVLSDDKQLFTRENETTD